MGRVFRKRERVSEAYARLGINPCVAYQKSSGRKRM
jgi:hypothetical protein